MPLPVIDDVYRCTFHWSGTLSTEPSVVSVQHFKDQTGTASYGDLASALDGAVQVHQFEGIDDSTKVDYVDIEKLDNNGLVLTYPLSNWVGSGGDVEPIPGLNILVVGKSGIFGRTGVGRIFLPSVVEQIIDHGRISTGGVAELTTAWNDWNDDLPSTYDFEWGVASYKTGVFAPYIHGGIVVRPWLAVIRRRRRYT